MRAFRVVVTVWITIATTLPLLAQTSQAPAQPQKAVPTQSQRNAPTQPQPEASKQAPIAAAQSEQNQSPQSPKTPPFGTLLKKTVGFLTVDYRDGDRVGQERGTAFFVFYEDKRLPENRGFIYLVTNRHMAQPRINGHVVSVLHASLRLNLRATGRGSQSAEGELPLGQLHWYFPADEAVDLAVIPLVPDDTVDYMPFPVSWFATKEVIATNNIAEGDAVLFAGFFYQFPGQKKIEPIVRQGILAMMPDEDLTTTLGRPGHLYLTDA